MKRNLKTKIKNVHTKSYCKSPSLLFSSMASQPHCHLFLSTNLFNLLTLHHLIPKLTHSPFFNSHCGIERHSYSRVTLFHRVLFKLFSFLEFHYHFCHVELNKLFSGGVIFLSFLIVKVDFVCLSSLI